jgi:hypothetical protein
MRLFQFVKTFEEPTAAMLLENFIRGSGIYCRENQEAVDALVPVVYATSKKDVFGVEQTKAILVQARLRKRYQSPKDKEKWLKSVANLDLVKSASKDSPWVALFLELGGPEDKGDNGGQRPKKHRGLPFEIMERDFGYAIFVRMNRLSQIDPSLKNADSAFQRLLESTIDPADSSNIPEEFQPAIRQMFKTQPYMLAK